MSDILNGQPTSGASSGGGGDAASTIAPGLAWITTYSGIDVFAS